MTAVLPRVDQPTTSFPVSLITREFRSPVNSCVDDAALESDAKNWNCPTSFPEQARDPSTPLGVQTSNLSKSDEGAREPNVFRASATVSSGSPDFSDLFLVCFVDDAGVALVSRGSEDPSGDVTGVTLGGILVPVPVLPFVHADNVIVVNNTANDLPVHRVT